MAAGPARKKRVWPCCAWPSPSRTGSRRRPPTSGAGTWWPGPRPGWPSSSTTTWRRAPTGSWSTSTTARPAWRTASPSSPPLAGAGAGRPRLAGSCLRTSGTGKGARGLGELAQLDLGLEPEGRQGGGRPRGSRRPPTVVPTARTLPAAASLRGRGCGWGRPAGPTEQLGPPAGVVGQGGDGALEVQGAWRDGGDPRPARGGARRTGSAAPIRRGWSARSARRPGSRPAAARRRRRGRPGRPSGRGRRPGRPGRRRGSGGAGEQRLAAEHDRAVGPREHTWAARRRPAEPLARPGRPGRHGRRRGGGARPGGAGDGPGEGVRWRAGERGGASERGVMGL